MHGQSSPNFPGCRAEGSDRGGRCACIVRIPKTYLAQIRYTAITLDRPVNNCHGYYLWQELIPVDYELFR